MRIGQWELRGIRDKILNDLYDKPEKDLASRKARIAEQNREYFLEPFMSTLSTLPDALIAHNKEYNLQINYGNDLDENKKVKEIWAYRSDKPLINPMIPAESYYNQIPAQPLDTRLHEVAEILCKDILHIRAERAAMSEYLITTTERESGSLQLRKTWPESLHRFLPAEPVKVPRKSTGTGTQKVEVDKPVVPDSLNIRLTENLLEEI